MKTLLHARDLGHGDKNHPRVAGINLSLGQGEIVGLLGVNGAGKSTTLALLTGALAPTTGSVQVLGLDLHKHPRQAKRHIGLLAERPTLYPDLTVDENLAFAGRLRGLGKAELNDAVSRIKRQCGLDDYGKRLAAKLSRGFTQRLGVAQAMIHRPDILVLDEPTVGLDPAQATTLRELIKEVSPTCGIILASHILLDMEQLCQRLIVLNDGRQVAEATMQQDRPVSIRLHLKSPPATLDPLRELPGVASARLLADGWIRLALEQEPGDLAELVACKGWGMTAFVPEKPDLEALLSRSISSPPEAGSKT